MIKEEINVETNIDFPANKFIMKCIFNNKKYYLKEDLHDAKQTGFENMIEGFKEGIINDKFEFNELK